MMDMSDRNLILYFEDDPLSMSDYIAELRERYDVRVGAHAALWEDFGERQVDLVILDVMIHRRSPQESGSSIDNVQFEAIGWDETGAEFLRLLRDGRYEQFWIARDVPVIVATARVSFPVKQRILGLDVQGYLEKPFSIDALEQAVQQALADADRPRRE
jgi:CheY-like chemotaxis protein